MKLISTFDSLTILNHLRVTLGPVSLGELCLYAYMACWLFVYRRNSPAHWGYTFSANETGAPYSPELDLATTHLLRAGHVAESSAHLSITNGGTNELRALSELYVTTGRREYLDASCSTSLVLPSGVLRGAMVADPDISAARTMNTSREMFTHEALIPLKNDFATIRRSLEALQDDLMPAAAVWAAYMNEQTLQSTSRQYL